MAAPYISEVELQEYLDQTQGKPEVRGPLIRIIARACSIIDEYLNFGFADYPTTASDVTVYSYGDPVMRLPAHQLGSITAVKDAAGNTIASTSYSESADGSLQYGGVQAFGWPYANIAVGGWPPGRYVVTAKWGYGPAPDAIKEVALELAVNIWRGKDRGLWTDVIGVEGQGGLRYTGMINNQQRAILDRVKHNRRPVKAGFA